MAGETIAIDIDDVLANMSSELIKFHNDTYGTSLTREDFKTYDLWKSFKCSPDESAKRLNLFYESEYFRNIKPLKHSVESVDELLKDHELIVTTSRFGPALNQTNPWIDRYFPGKFSEVIFTKFYTFYSSENTKASICKDRNANVIIEDSPIYAKQCADAGILVYLLDYPWNESLEKQDYIIRVDDWREVVKKIRNHS